jgi:hypothetical protein
MHRLAGGVDARVGPPGADGRDCLVTEARQRVFDHALHGALVGLAREPVKVSAVVGEVDAEPNAGVDA